jgi:hypothetical protein
MALMRLAELLAGLSMVADIGMGFEPGEAGRAVLVAMELCDLRGGDDPSDVYYTTMLQHVGCTAYAHEAAAMLGGDEIAVKRAAMLTDFSSVRAVTRTYLPGLAPAAGFVTRCASRARRRHGAGRSCAGTAGRTARWRRERRSGSV